MSEWQPITDAPEGELILMFEDGSQFTGRYYTDVGAIPLWCDVGDVWPSHWMPLPEPPK